MPNMPHDPTLRELLEELLRTCRDASNRELPVTPDEAVLVLDVALVCWLAASRALAEGDRQDVARSLGAGGDGDALVAIRRLRASVLASDAGVAAGREAPATAHAAARTIHLLYCREGGAALDRLIAPFVPQLAALVAAERVPR